MKTRAHILMKKERAQKVLDQLHQKLNERLEARIKSYTKEYKQYMDESSDEYHPVKGERLPEVIKMLRDSHEYWKRHIRSEHSLIYEDNIGGTGAYYWANLWEIEQLVKELGGTIKSPSLTEDYAARNFRNEIQSIQRLQLWIQAISNYLPKVAECMLLLRRRAMAHASIADL